jgi:hypothetical protein
MQEDCRLITDLIVVEQLGVNFGASCTRVNW